MNTACTFKITWEIIHCYIFYIASMFLQCFKSTHHFKCRNSATFPTCKYNFTLSFMSLELLITIFPLTGTLFEYHSLFLNVTLIFCISSFPAGGAVYFPWRSPDCQESTRSENRCQVCSLLSPQCHSDSPGECFTQYD